MNLLEGKIQLKRATVGKNNTKIIKIDGDSFPYKDIFKKHGAFWNKFGKYWYWWANREDEKTIIDNKIKPAIAEVREKHKDFIQEIDEIISAISAESPSDKEEVGISKSEETDIKKKLQSFKEMLLNIGEDEEFKDVMKKVIDIKAAQGQKFSFGNAILIFIQNKNAGMVNSKTNWFKFYNREVKPTAKTLLVWAPQGSKFKQSDKKKSELKSMFYKKINKKPGDKLTPGEGIKLKELTRDTVYATRFKLVPVYSVSDTIQKEGTEDFIKKAEDARKNVKWFEDNMISDKVRPVYTGLIKYAEANDLKIEIVDDLGGARGVSMSGRIKILKNEGNDVGLTKTLAHEITHELLHQSYLKQKGKSAGKYHIGGKFELTTETVEQQAELSAWMFMYAFGFDVKTTSLNYTVMWGGNKENMLQVFNTVSKVVNHLVDEVNKQIKSLNEAGNAKGKHISAEKIADLTGFGKDFDELESKQDLQERLKKKINL
tara:strand:+ start:750 stop:2210 length:1461 start_codon:yes stop_codon:yes gene_type:complete